MGYRFGRSWALGKESFTVLRANPQMLLFPVVSSIVTIALIVTFVLPFYFLKGTIHLGRSSRPVEYVAGFLFYFLSYFIVVFFNSALISCAYEGLQGRKTTFYDGIHVATQRLGKILGWAAIASTVGIVLQIIREESGIVGKIVSSIIGIAWNVATFFVVPILVVEQISPVEAIKKSTAVLKATWGETLIGQNGIGLALLPLALIPLVPIFVSLASGIDALIVASLAISAIYWAGLCAVGSSLQTIFQTAVYFYATTGAIPTGFSDELVQGAFAQKPKRGFLGR